MKYTIKPLDWQPDYDEDSEGELKKASENLDARTPFGHYYIEVGEYRTKGYDMPAVICKARWCYQQHPQPTFLAPNWYYVYTVAAAKQRAEAHWMYMIERALISEDEEPKNTGALYEHDGCSGCEYFGTAFGKDFWICRKEVARTASTCYIIRNSSDPPDYSSITDAGDQELSSVKAICHNFNDRQMRLLVFVRLMRSSTFNMLYEAMEAHTQGK